MSFAQLAEQLVTVGFAAFGEPVTVTPRDGGPVSTSAIIERWAEVADDYGVTVDNRIEVELLSADVPGANRGTVVAAGSDSFRLLDPITDTGRTTRWIAARV